MILYCQLIFPINFNLNTDSIFGIYLYLFILPTFDSPKIAALIVLVPTNVEEQ